MSGDPRHEIVEVKRADGTVAWSGPRHQLDAALAESQPSDPMAARKAKQAAKLARANAIHDYVAQRSTWGFDHEKQRRSRRHR